MGFKENKAKQPGDRRDERSEKYFTSLAAVKLRQPALPQLPAGLPGQEGRRYPVLQELAAARQDICDEFSKKQLELHELKSRVEEDMAALTKNAAAKPPGPAALPANEPAPVRAPAPVPSLFSPQPEPAPAAGSRPLFARILFAAAVCAAAFGLYKFFGSAPGFSFSLPPTRAAGFCMDRDGANAFFADPQRQLLFTVSASEKRVTAMQSFPAHGLKGLAFDGTSFWSTDGSSIYRHSSSDGYAVAGTYKAGPGVEFICWDGKDLWAASAGGKLTLYSAGETLAQKSVYAMPEGRTAGISVSDGKLWLLDPGSGKLYAYKPGARPELLNTADIRSLLPRGAVSGFSVAGGYLWIISENPAELARIELDHIKFS